MQLTVGSKVKSLSFSQQDRLRMAGKGECMLIDWLFPCPVANRFIVVVNLQPVPKRLHWRHKQNTSRGRAANIAQNDIG